MTKDIILSGNSHRGLFSLRTRAMCFSFKWIPHTQCLYPDLLYSHILMEKLVMFVVLAFSVAKGIKKVLRIRKWVGLTENSATLAWNLNTNNGNFNNNNKTNENSVRPVSAPKRYTFDVFCVQLMKFEWFLIDSVYRNTCLCYGKG